MSTGSLLLKGFTLIASDHPLNQQSVDLLIEEGTLSRVEKANSISADPGYNIVEGKQGQCISPGWVDMQCILSDPGREPVESLSDLAKAAVMGGFTHVLGYPNVAPAMDTSQMVTAVLTRGEKLPIELHVCGALTEHIDGKELAELYDMQQAGALAFTDGNHPVTSAGTLLRALRYTQAFDGLIIHYPTTPSLTREGQMNEGRQSTLLGMPGIPEEAESVALARDLELWSYAPQKMHLQPITSPMALDKIGSDPERYADISVGCPVYYFLLDESRVADYDSNVKVDPPLRAHAQVKRLAEALAKGTIDVLTSGHQARDLEEKDVPFPAAEPGMHSLATFFPMALAALIAPEVLSLDTFVERVSHAPRRILGLNPVSFTPGEKADYTLFSPIESWKLELKDLPGRAVNSPLLNQTLTGKVVGIVQKGRYTASGIH